MAVAGEIPEHFPAGHMYLFLTRLEPWEESGLHIVVAQGRAGEVATHLPSELGTLRQIEPDPDGWVIGLYWSNYVAYAVRDRAFAVSRDERPAQLIELTASPYLDHVARTSANIDDLGVPLRHWELETLNHVLDVVSFDPPRVNSVPGL